MFRKKKARDTNDSDSAEFWDEAAYVRAITPTTGLRHSFQSNEFSMDKDKDQRDAELNRRLSKYSEKRNERMKANKGFFLRDKENEDVTEDDARVRKSKKISFTENKKNN